MTTFKGKIYVEVEGSDALDALKRLSDFAECAVQMCTGLPNKMHTVVVDGHVMMRGEDVPGEDTES